MNKITTEQIGDFKGTVYLMSLGYTYKITYHGKVVDRSYAYIIHKHDAVSAMKNSLRMHAGMTRDLFDLERI